MGVEWAAEGESSIGQQIAEGKSSSTRTILYTPGALNLKTPQAEYTLLFEAYIKTPGG